MPRDFECWLSNFIKNISDYKYYVDFEKVYKNIDSVKIELNILNSLIGSKNIEKDFISIVTRYPETLKCIPILLAVRLSELSIWDNSINHIYNFNQPNLPLKQYAELMQKTGLFDLLQNHLVSNLVDYVTGVEVGLDSNARKNRTGDLMENIVESYIVKAGFRKNIDYFKEMSTSQISQKWNIDLSNISNNGKVAKRFDFVIKTNNMVYGIEANFYSTSGSKLNEVARSYKKIAQEAQSIEGFSFIWFTDGCGWNKAKNNLQEAFESIEHIYCIKDLKDNIIPKIIL